MKPGGRVAAVRLQEQRAGQQGEREQPDRRMRPGYSGGR